MRILITNDDGIEAPGIKQLWLALSQHFDCTVVAPASGKSGVGLACTVRRTLGLKKHFWGDTPVWSVSGTPVDCVKMALNMILDEAPDMIVSGINWGSNAGRNVLYSGTVGGVVEGVFRGIPGIAFSHSLVEEHGYAEVADYIVSITKYVGENQLAAGSLLNVNFPEIDGGFKGLKMASQGMSYHVEDIVFEEHKDEVPHYWLGCEFRRCPEKSNSDITFLEQGYVTAAPIYVNDLTNYQLLAGYQTGFESQINKSK